MDKDEFKDRIGGVALAIYQISLNRAKTCEEKENTVNVLMEEFYQECRDAFGKVQKFG